MKNKKEYKNLKPVVVVASVIIALGIIFGILYFTGIFSRHGKFPENFQGNEMNFQLNESQISEVNSFFNANPTSDEVQNYCKENRNLCFYYCKDSSDLEICKQVMNFNRNDSMMGQPPGAANA